MRLHPDGTLVVSATDLVAFLACDHLTTLELGRAQGRWAPPPHQVDPTLELLRTKGEEHERRFLERQRAAGRTVTEIARPVGALADIRSAADDTLDAMRRGDDVVFQATLFDGRWLGYADFLLKVDRPSVLGPWSYEVADTKLARAVKGGAVLQVCVYSDLLAAGQGAEPERIHVVTGDGTTHSLRLDDFGAYYRAVKARFELEVFGDAATPPRDPTESTTYPDQVEHCRVCSWYPDCADWRRADDHLSLVAGLARTATERLHAASVWTRRSLATLDAAVEVPDLDRRTLARLREQAAVQVRGEDERRLLVELVPPDPGQPGQGLAALPKPSPLDCFFDIESDPWAAEDGTGFGLEYLLGVAYREAGEERYEAIWGTDRDAERRAFERFIDLVTARRAADPGMHVYHYGGYESGAVKRLMQRHGTRAEELDQLLRDEVFVDLLGVVRQGLRASVESYSLKRIEKFYLPERTGPVTDAGFSVVEFEAWLTDQDDQHLRDLADYNRDDCISTFRLRDWLEGLRREAIAVRGWELPRPSTIPAPPSEALMAAIEQTRRREVALRDGIQADARLRSPEDQGRWLLADVIDWHRREDRPQWWNWYRLRDASLDDLIGDREALAGLEHVEDVETRKQSVVRRYRFPQQETKLRPGDKPFDPDWGEKGEGAGEIVAIDLAAGTVDLLRGPSKLDHHPVRLIPTAPIPTDQQRAALGQLADFVVERGIDADGPWRAGRDLLLRRRARLRDGISQGPLVRPGESVALAARRMVIELDGGVLAIQGPPGTGKTWTGARMIVDLIRAGRTVGVTAQAHKAITNLLDAFGEAATEAHLAYRAIQKCDEGDDGSTLDEVTRENSPGKVAAAVAAGTYPIVAGTPWLFAREDMRGTVDVLVVDEAGQMSLANVLAMAGACRSIVLLGDPTNCRRSARASIRRAPAPPPSNTSSATRSPCRRTSDCCSTPPFGCTRTSTDTSLRPSTAARSSPPPP